MVELERRPLSLGQPTSLVHTIPLHRRKTRILIRRRHRKQQRLHLRILKNERRTNKTKLSRRKSSNMQLRRLRLPLLRQPSLDQRLETSNHRLQRRHTNSSLRNRKRTLPELSSIQCEYDVHLQRSLLFTNRPNTLHRPIKNHHVPHRIQHLHKRHKRILQRPINHGITTKGNIIYDIVHPYYFQDYPKMEGYNNPLDCANGVWNSLVLPQIQKFGVSNVWCGETFCWPRGASGGGWNGQININYADQQTFEVFMINHFVSVGMGFQMWCFFGSSDKQAQIDALGIINVQINLNKSFFSISV